MGLRTFGHVGSRAFEASRPSGVLAGPRKYGVLTWTRIQSLYLSTLCFSPPTSSVITRTCLAVMSRKVGSIEVLQCPVKDPELSDPRYDGPEPSLKILEKGFRKGPNAAAFQTATVFEKDVKISLRDGVKIRADIFRPCNDGKVPALIA